MSQLLPSFSKLDINSSDCAEFITYVTNLMELILSGSTNDKYNESLLDAINSILSSCQTMRETLSSVHVSLAVKSNLQNATKTLVHLISNSEKFAKTFRKLVVKETNGIENFEKFLLATIASLKYKADVKSKFLKEVKKVLQPEIISLMQNNNSRIPKNAMSSLLDLIKLLISDFDVEFEQLDLNNNEVSRLNLWKILF